MRPNNVYLSPVVDIWTDDRIVPKSGEDTLYFRFFLVMPRPTFLWLSLVKIIIWHCKRIMWKAKQKDSVHSNCTRVNFLWSMPYLYFSRRLLRIFQNILCADSHKFTRKIRLNDVSLKKTWLRITLTDLKDVQRRQWWARGANAPKISPPTFCEIKKNGPAFCDVMK